MGLPMLPSRVSNIIGEWAWNPWQWGDTIPQRSGDGIIADKTPIVEGTTSPAAESPQHHASSLTWKFRRSSSNQMQLPDIPKDRKKSAEDSGSNIPTPPIFDATAANLVPKDESPTSGTGGAANLSNSNSEVSKEDSKESTKSKAPQSQAPDAAVEVKDQVAEANSATRDITGTAEKESTPEKGDAFFIESTSTSENSPQQPPSASVLPLPPVTSNESSSPSPSMVFIDKDKGSDNESMRDKSSQDDSTKKKEKKPLPNSESKATIEMLPSMLDNQNYDFRDRRLDYAKLSVKKSEHSP